jgi:threonine synthase
LAEVVGLRCVRCRAPYESTVDHFGCPACEPQVPANLEVVYAAPALEPKSARRLVQTWTGRPPGLWRFAETLPVEAAQAISLGEGGTPLITCSKVGETIGLTRLMAKNESQNPTWSFKDRLASVAISWARANGRRGIAISSSGNAGAAAAAYAARAGMPCLVFTTRTYPGAMQRLMRSYGAMVVATATGPDRWTLNRAVAREWGWLPLSNTTDPPVGSHPIGIEGYKSIAFEICQDLGWQPPDAMIIPVAYGDAISGIYRGFSELLSAGLIGRLPRLIAAETYPSLSGALAENAPGPVSTGGFGSKAVSVATPCGSYQALRALRESKGTAVAIADDEAFQAHRELREKEGLFVELSSAICLAAARRLRERGELLENDRVILLITSSGLKDSELTADGGELPLVEPHLGELATLLKNKFGFAA